VATHEIGLLGARSLVGSYLCQLARIEGQNIFALSRKKHLSHEICSYVHWFKLNGENGVRGLSERLIRQWISVAPIWVLPEYFSLLECCCIQRLVAVSSTSRFTKVNSKDIEERDVAKRLGDAEQQLLDWGNEKDIEIVILRPTLIYGDGKDKNISEIGNFINKFGLFPLFGSASGLRQPIHAEDVAKACLQALDAMALNHQSYNISGGETLSYRDMVFKVFDALNCKRRVVSIPIGVFKALVTFARVFPKYKNWTPSMAIRMNSDMVFDHSDATRDFGFSPRPFVLSRSDLP